MKTMMTLAAAACCIGFMTGCETLCMKDGKCSECSGKGMSAAQCPFAKTGAINTPGLKALLSARTPMTVVDARAGKYDDGNRIPGAKALAPDATEQQVAALLPDKQALVVTYCANLKCPASQMLAERLRTLGYSNVLEYHEGIKGWIDAGNAIEKAAR